MTPGGTDCWVVDSGGTTVVTVVRATPGGTDSWVVDSGGTIVVTVVRATPGGTDSEVPCEASEVWTPGAVVGASSDWKGTKVSEKASDNAGWMDCTGEDALARGN